MTPLKVSGVVVAVVALPFLFQANSGCSFDTSGLCADPCVQPDDMSAPNSYLCSCTCTTSGVFTKEFRVQASADDAEETIADSVVDTLSPDLDLSSIRLVGVRFQAVSVPPGATILDAAIQFTSSTIGSRPVSYSIRAQSADNAPAFANVVGDISARMLTMESATWSPPDWAAAEHGPNELAPGLKMVLQEVVSRPGWASGNAVVFVFALTSGIGARHALSADGRGSRVPVLSVTYQEAAPPMIGPQDLPVCMLQSQNPNLNGGLSPSDEMLADDCTVNPLVPGSGRVEMTLTGLAEACHYPANCTCTFQPDSRKFADKCNTTCVENPVEADCSDFDPVHGQFQATNAPGDQPVCLTNSPLSQGIFGRRTRCLVSGDATVQVDGNDPDDQPTASGILEFLGTPCPGGGCLVGLEYRLDITTVTFSSFFTSETFKNLAGLGDTPPGNDASLDMAGDGTFGVGTADVSARGTRGSAQLALFTQNSNDIHVNVLFGSMGPTCALSGTLLGNVDPELKRCEPHGPTANNICTDDSNCTDDPDCSDGDCNCEKVPSASLTLGLDIGGGVVNQPPTADAGEDQTLECTDADGTPVTLDGSGSGDLDDNLRLFSWRRGSRVGPEVGTDPVLMILQPLGSETYVLRIIDALGQTDEIETMVDIVDTTPPEVHCGVAKHVLEIVNHNLVNVGLAASAEDQCEGTLPITVKVFGDEDDELNTGDGVFSPDAKSLGVGTLRLRAERRGTGNGRVYLIVVDASDSTGNRAFDCCTVIVPRNPRLQASLQSAEKQAVAAQNFCLAHDGAAPATYFVIGDGAVIGPKQ